MNPYLNEAEELLVQELRSGKRAQVRGYLRRRLTDKLDGYCCLGVACEVLGEPAEQIGEVCRFGSGEDCSCYCLTENVRQLLGWKGNAGLMALVDRDGAEVDLAHLNDGGCTFDQIADVIEAGLVLREED